MKFVIDHDYHLHSNLSPCAKDPLQTPETMLKWAEENGLRDICLTDHFWDAAVRPAGDYLCRTYRNNDYACVSSVLPLPQSERTKFHFGCEGEMDFSFQIGISPEIVKKMDFIVIPTTHLHMPKLTVHPNATLEERAVLYSHRIDAFIDSGLPAGKTGLAHMVCSLMAPGQWEDHLRVLEMIPDSVFYHQFRRIREKDYGVELNIDVRKYTPEALQTVLRPFFIAKECGCKFYLGSDAHTTAECARAMENFELMISLLDMKESEKYKPFA